MYALRTTLLSLPLLLLTACPREGPAPEPPADTADAPVDDGAGQRSAEEIRAAFRALHDAWASRDGAAAHAQLATATRERWQRAKGYALHAPKDELRQRAVLMQLHVLALREGAGFEALEAMDDVALTQHALDQGLFGGQLLQGVTLVDFTVDGDAATCGARDGGGREMPFGFAFAREDGAWKVDLVPTYADANEMMLAKLKLEGLHDEEAALLMAVGNATGITASESVWVPLSERLGD